jgi:hypothetical protein
MGDEDLFSVYSGSLDNLTDLFLRVSVVVLIFIFFPFLVNLILSAPHSVDVCNATPLISPLTSPTKVRFPFCLGP